jgi:hypothetical protein
MCDDKPMQTISVKNIKDIDTKVSDIQLEKQYSSFRFIFELVLENRTLSP